MLRPVSKTLLVILVIGIQSFCSANVLKKKTGSKIVGGQDASEGQFPYQVSLQLHNRHFCGGSLVTLNYVLTAAHCLQDGHPSDFTVLVGTHTLDTGGQTFGVDAVYVHSDWEHNDIAVVKLSSPVTLGPNVALITLATESPRVGTECTLTGWGKTSYPGSTPNNLQYLEVGTISLEECQAAHDPPFVPLTEKNVCTLTQEGEGACKGDSGGALVFKTTLPDADPVYTQYGIASWGKPCALGKPNVFTSVASYNAWINIAITDLV